MDKREKDILEYIILILLTLSVIGYFLIIFVYLKFKHLRKLHRKLLFTLAVYDFISNITFYIPASSNEKLCKTQSFFLIFFSLIPPFWSAMVAIITWLLIVYHKTKRQLEKVYFYSQIFVLLFAFTVSLLSVLTSANKPLDTDWCVPDRLWMIVTYSWYWIVIFTCLIFYMLSIFRIRRLFYELKKLDSTAKSAKKQELTIQLKMLCIPLTFIWCYLWPSICRVMEFQDKTPPTWLRFMHGINFPLCGFIYCIIFVFFTTPVRKTLFSWLMCKANLSSASLQKFDDWDNREQLTTSSDISSIQDSFGDSDSNSVSLSHNENNLKIKLIEN
ncbi:g protein-coupled receptor [Anaeramoeba flamelloides]|uniref:G protein-coupled receptor n=1 Tax=Anaeramoeba flamelloides TaxID=1746091 RepID=A0AAV7Y1L0_9EUKA|nr:g protein-coupled receptor [Anaeramoeba flamelloides]